MHAFKLSMTAGAACRVALEGTAMQGLCIVNDDDVERARDGALLALDALGFGSCTFLDVAKLPASPELARYSEPMRQAIEEARRDGVSVVLYPPQGEH